MPLFISARSSHSRKSKGGKVKELTTAASELRPAFNPLNLFRMSVVKRTNDHNLLGNVVVVKVRDRMYTMSRGLRGMPEYQNSAIRYPGGGNIMLIALTLLWNTVLHRHTCIQRPALNLRHANHKHGC